MPLVSFLVIAGTGRPYLAEALASLIQQGTADWEAIVVECCAEERDTDSAYAQLRSVNDSRIRVVPYGGTRCDFPPYASRKWNFALTHTRGGLIAFLDDDDMKEDNWLEAMAAPFVNDPSISITVCGGSVIDKHGSRIGPLFGTPSLSRELLLRGQFITTGQLLVRRETLEAIGRFDEELACAEDYDACLRLSAHPWRVVDSTKCLKRDSGDNACYRAGPLTQDALRRVISKQGVPYICPKCRVGFSSTEPSFVWYAPNEEFKHWHYRCAGRPWDHAPEWAAHP